MFVISLFTSNNATPLREAQICQHSTLCNIMLHFVTVCTMLSVVRPRRSRSAAAYSRQTFPWTICRSVGPYVRKYVRASVGLSSGLWENGGSDPDAVWHRRSGESRDKAGSIRFADRSTRRGTFGGAFGARHCIQWALLATFLNVVC